MSIVFLSFTLGVFVCSRQNPLPDGDRTGGVTLVDDLGHTVHLDQAPMRIVSLSPSNTEILFALGLADRVVGVTSYCDYPPEVTTKTVIGGYADPSLEKVVSLQPELVLAAYGNDVVFLEQLNRLHIPVYGVNSETLADLLEDIRKIARLTGVPENGEALAATLDKRIQGIQQQVALVAENRRPKVFFGGWQRPIFTPGPDTFIHDLIHLAGGVNVAGDSKGAWLQYSLEMIVAKNPDVWVNTYDKGEDPDQVRQKALKALRSEQGWRSIAAVQKGRIYLVEADLIMRPGPRVVEGLARLAACLHPELFEGLP